MGDNANDLTSLVADPNVSMHEGKAFACQVDAGRRGGPAPKPTKAPGALADARAGAGHAGRGAARGEIRPWRLERRSWPRFPRAATLLVACRCSWNASSSRSAAAAAPEPRPATGFYTDTTVCIGCKACEVACKQWNQLPADGFDWTGNSYDNTGELVGHLLAAREVHRAVARQGRTGVSGSTPTASIPAAGS